MKMDPQLTRIDLMLAEFAALCYCHAHGGQVGASVIAYRQRILGEVQALRPEVAELPTGNPLDSSGKTGYI